jgi:hypothetical protein
MAYIAILSLKINSNIEAELESVSSYVLDHIINKKEHVINVLNECVSKIPEKVSIYVTLVGLLNIKNPNFVEEVFK